MFDYPYPKAVLKVDIAEKHGVQEKHSGKAASHKMTMRIRVRNDHSVALRDCSVHVLGYRTNGHWTEIDERLRGGDDGMFRVPEGPIVRRTITFLSRDISDPITPQPFLFVLRDRLLPLSEGTKYEFEIELRSHYPSPTLATLVLETKTGLDAEARIEGIRLADYEIY